MVVDHSIYNIATYIAKEKEKENEEEKKNWKEKGNISNNFFTLGNINNSKATTKQ